MIVKMIGVINSSIRFEDSIRKRIGRPIRFEIRFERKRTIRRSLLQGHPRSMILAPIKSVSGTSYWSSIVTLVLSCSDIRAFVHLKPLFHAQPLFRPKFIGVPWYLGLQTDGNPG